MDVVIDYHSLITTWLVSFLKHPPFAHTAWLAKKSMSLVHFVLQHELSFSLTGWVGVPIT